MKLVYITSTFPYGPGEAFLIPELRDLVRRGHELTVVPLNPAGPVRHSLDGCALDLLSRNILAPSSAFLCLKEFAVNRDFRRFLLRILRETNGKLVAARNLLAAMKGVWLGRLLKKRNIDHIHCHWASCSATMAWAASLVSGIPWSMTAHRWDIFANNLFCQKARSASFVRFISNDGVNLARGIGLETLENVHVIHMGVPLPATYSIRAASPVRSARPVILCAANLVPVKGHSYLISAFDVLRRRNIDCELWLAGDGPLRAALEGQVKSLGLEGRTRFLGSVSHARLLGLYEQGQIAMVVLPSLHEGIPVSLMEAMSFSVPVVSTPTGGTAELVGSEEGILVPPEDPEALASAMETLLADPTRARLLGEAGRRKVLAEFSAEASGDRLIHLFEQHRTPTQNGCSDEASLSIQATSGCL